jgi:hypothetical protein
VLIIVLRPPGGEDTSKDVAIEAKYTTTTLPSITNFDIKKYEEGEVSSFIIAPYFLTLIDLP